MTDAQQLLNSISQLLNRPLDQWVDKQMGKQLRQDVQQSLSRAAELLGDYDPQIRALRSRNEEVQSKVNAYQSQLRSSGGTVDTPYVDGVLPQTASDRSINAQVSPAQPPLLTPQRGSTPALIEPQAAPASLLYESGPFGEAVTVFRRQQTRFELQQKLQTGLFSTGFAALDRQTGAAVVIKFPAQDSWFTRFEECSNALRSEAQSLKAIHPLLVESAVQNIARPVAPVDEGFLHVEGALQPVPWFAQVFAHGHRLSTPGTLPMRDAQERVALQILVQVTGLVQELYRYGWAHRDLKVDCLFWDSTSQQVEVIDWNRAVHMPSQEDRDLEFSALQYLVKLVFLGPLFEWSAPDQIAHDLFTAFRGVSLSRGTRLLLLRLFSPTLPIAIRTASDLHTALTELLRFWDAPLTESPDWSNLQPAARSRLLSQLSIELQRPSETSLAAAQRRDWYRQGLVAVQQTIRGAVGVWITVHETMRAELSSIEQLWMWLPDIWPLTWVVPLSRVWFAEMPRGNDRDLARCVEAMLNRRWDSVIQMTQNVPALTPGVRQKLDALHQVALAYQDLEQIERMLHEASPDYSGAMSRLVAVRDLLPQEWLVSDLLAQIDAGIQGVAQLNRLLGAVSDLQQQRPSEERQRRLWEVFQQLQRLGLDDPRYDQQSTLITHLDQAQRSYALAQQELAHGNWSATEAETTRWIDDATLHMTAPDLLAALAALKQQAAHHSMSEQLSRWEQQIRHALSTGQLSEATHIAQAAAATIQPETAPEFAEPIHALASALTTLQSIWQALHNETYAVAQKTLPAQLPDMLQALATEFGQIAALGLKLEQSPTLAQLLAVYRMLENQRRADQFAVLTQPLWSRLHDRVVGWLELCLLDELSQPTVNDDQLAVYEEALSYLYRERSEPLSRAAALLKQRLAQPRQVQGSTTINTELRQLSDQQSQLTQAVTVIQDRSRDLQDQMYARDQSLVQRLDDVQSALRRMNEAQQPLLYWVEQQMARSQRPKLLARSRRWMRGVGLARWQQPSSVPRRRLPLHWIVLGGAIIVALIGWALVSGLPRIFNAGAVGIVGASPATTTVGEPRPIRSSAALSTTSPATTRALSPAGTSTRLSPSPAAAVAVSVSGRQVTALPATLLLQAPGIGKVTSLEAVVGQTRLRLSTQSTTVDDQLQIILPAQLLSGEPNLTFPQSIVLQPAGAFQPVTVNIQQPLVEVQGLGANDPPMDGELFEGQAYIWKDQTRRVPATDAVKPQGTPDGKNDFVLLSKGDRVKILDGSGDLYQIMTISNRANNNASSVLNQTGWVRRVFIDGNR